jgi:hypothetical protein
LELGARGRSCWDDGAARSFLGVLDIFILFVDRDIITRSRQKSTMFGLERTYLIRLWPRCGDGLARLCSSWIRFLAGDLTFSILDAPATAVDAP